MPLGLSLGQERRGGSVRTSLKGQPTDVSAFASPAPTERGARDSQGDRATWTNSVPERPGEVDGRHGSASLPRKSNRSHGANAPLGCEAVAADGCG